MATQPDASGGLGSFSKDLLGILTGAANTIAQSPVALGRLLNLGDLTQTVDAQGNTVLAAAPAPDPTPADHIRDAFSNPIVLAAGVAAVIALVVVIARR